MSGLPEDRNSELRALFFESAGELLQSLNEAGLDLEANPADEEVIRRVRRAVHTLKGDSAACGFHKLSELAHELEDALSPQMGQSAGSRLADLVLVAADNFCHALSLSAPRGAAGSGLLARYDPRFDRRSGTFPGNGARFRWCRRSLSVDRIRTVDDFRSGASGRDRL